MTAVVAACLAVVVMAVAVAIVPVIFPAVSAAGVLLSLLSLFLLQL